MRVGGGRDRSIEVSADEVVLRHPELHVGEIEGHPGRRRVRVAAEVHVGGDLDGVTLTETIIVRAARAIDAPVKPTSEPVVVSRQEFPAVVGSTERRTEVIVDRSSLDVTLDWWSSGHGGETEPIAEWVDRIVADVQLSIGDDVVAQATTPIVEGSWGAIGDGRSDHPIT